MGTYLNIAVLKIYRPVGGKHEPPSILRTRECGNEKLATIPKFQSETNAGLKSQRSAVWGIHRVEV
jgi:hypothetical protein